MLKTTPNLHGFPSLSVAVWVAATEEMWIIDFIVCPPESVISISQQVSMYLLLQTGSSSDYVAVVSARACNALSLLITNIHMRYFSLKAHLNPACLCRFSFIPTVKFSLHSASTRSLRKSLLLQMARALQLPVSTHCILQLHITSSVQSSLCSRRDKPETWYLWVLGSGRSQSARFAK